MAIDPYQPCPCGSDKKVKFCCGADITADLAKIEEALQGEQRMVALDLVNRAIEKHGDRACLYAFKATAHMELREFPNARKDVDKLLELQPRSTSGNAMAALLDCLEGNTHAAIERLQLAMEASQGKLNATTYDGLGAVGRSLALAGEPLAARAHIALQVSASGGRDEAAIQALMEIDGSGQLPLVAQGLLDLSAPDASGPLSAAGVAEYNAALREAQQGIWLSAARRLEALAAKEGGDPNVWKTLGVLQASLGNNDKAREALRRYASIATVPREDAVEAEAVAQFLTDPTDVDLLSEMTVTYAVTDASALKESWLSSKKLQSVPFDPAQFRDDNSPPPQAVFLLLDRELSADSQTLSRDSVPKILGELVLYGKETDRPARVEFSTPKSKDYAARLTALQAALGEWAGEKLGEEETGKMSSVAAALMINWRFPDSAPADLRRRLMQEHRTAALLSIYPNLPLGVLDGKTIRQAAGDPALQVRALAAILLLDLAEPVDNPDYNQLRRSLGLPTADPIDPSSVRVANLSPAKLVRVEAAKLNDQDLVQTYRRAMIHSSVRLLKKFGDELVSRPSLDKEVDKGEVYELMARMSGDPNEMLDLIHKAQAAAVAGGRSPARYLLAELPIRLQRMEQQEFVRLVDVLRTKHANEPGISQALYSLLSQMGLLRGGPGGAGGPGGMPMGVPAAAAPAKSSGLWTPDQGPSAPAPQGETKSKLWLPGS